MMENAPLFELEFDALLEGGVEERKVRRKKIRKQERDGRDDEVHLPQSTAFEDVHQPLRSRIMHHSFVVQRCPRQRHHVYVRAQVDQVTCNLKQNDREGGSHHCSCSGSRRRGAEVHHSRCASGR